MLDVGFRWQEMTFSDKNRVKTEESVLFPFKKSHVKPGTVLIETVLSGDPLYFFSNAAEPISSVSIRFRPEPLIVPR